MAFSVVVSLGLVGSALCIGKEGPTAPHLPPRIFESLTTTIAPPAAAQHAQWACLPGYDLIDNTCHKIIEEEAFLGCAGIPAVNGTCDVILEPTMFCPDGSYTLRDGICSRIVETGIQFYCPKGYYDDGQYCAKQLDAEISMECPIGELVGDQCILTERRAHLVTSACPDGSKLGEDRYCWKDVETFDCTEEQKPGSVSVLTEPRKSHTHDGKKVVVTKGKGGTVFRGLIGKENTRPTTRLPPPPPPKVIPSIGKEMVSVSAPQQTAVEVVTKICSKKIQVDAIALVSCPDGFVTEGDHCLKQIITPPISVCANGELRDGTCQPAIHRVPKKPGCPKDSYFAREKCWTVETTPGDFKCPDSYFFNIDAFQCIATVQAEYECPVGLELIGTTCIGDVVRPAILVRPPKSFDSGHGKKYNA